MESTSDGIHEEVDEEISLEECTTDLLALCAKKDDDQRQEKQTFRTVRIHVIMSR